MRKAQPTLAQPIEYLRGVGPQKADILKTELGIHTHEDLLFHYPFRYIDKTKFHPIRSLTEEHEGTFVQIKGQLRRIENIEGGRSKRLVATLRDGTGSIELVWFKTYKGFSDKLKVGQNFIAFGRLNVYGTKLSIPHPEIEPLTTAAKENLTLDPVYPTTDKLTRRYLDARGIRKLTTTLLQKLTLADVPENLPEDLVKRAKFPSRIEALRAIHFPKDKQALYQAQRRLKFEELFFMQLRLLQLRSKRRGALRGFVFEKIGENFNYFYKNNLPFELTNAQKKVIKEIRNDCRTGTQMNRLLQGDVGSGKTIVALIVMLIALDNDYQSALLAPTEILAQQHYDSIEKYLAGMDVKVGFLSGSVKGKKRKKLLEDLATGEIDILIGTHAILEDLVVFRNLGLAITDEQHRFGVKQRARLWKKSHPYPPHVLVMTATPIPRTLAMTIYGDLDYSVIDELPPGRKPIITTHKYESGRLRVFGFMKEQIDKGRQVYVVYPLIEESEKLDLLNLEEGYTHIQKQFPPPKYQISVVHGKMKAADKDFEMQRFVEGQTQIMVATTVIEVGVNVPNATTMIIEHTERFGLAQLHQLRGRVGRGGEQSHCILMSSYKLSAIGKERINIMKQTNDGFKIAEADLRLRGPGNLDGVQQSGIVNLKLADLSKDQKTLEAARNFAKQIIASDPAFEKPENLPLKRYMTAYAKKMKGWNKIS